MTEAPPCVLIFGNEQAIGSARGQKFKAELEAAGFTVYSTTQPSPSPNDPEHFDWAVLVMGKMPPVLSLWQNYFRSFAHRPHFAAVVEASLPPNFSKEFAPEIVVDANVSFAALIAKIKSSAVTPPPDTDVTKVFQDNPGGSWRGVDTNSFLSQEYERGSELKLEPALSDDKTAIVLASEEAAEAVAPPSPPPPPSAPNSALSTDESWGEGVSLNMSAGGEPSVDAWTAVAPSPEAFAAAPLESIEEFVEKTRMVQVQETVFAALPNEPAPPTSSALSGDERQILQRYGTLKEREAREKDVAAHVLRKQIEQLEIRLERSETERRRQLSQLEEAEAKIRAFKDARDQDKFHTSKLESHHQEELRALQLRFDNSQFQASKAEKKLEEFREKVRNDIQRIRSRERELANRLELQKRDAEALLSTKDERLLQQKREIDRLEFEIESLKERMIDETQRAEDRAGKLTRALQSLRLATGMLSGMEEEVLPGAFSTEGGEGEAA